jgi:transposase
VNSEHIDPLNDIASFRFWLLRGFFINHQVKLQMAGKPKTMSQIKQLLRLHKQGTAKKAIAKTLSMSKNTVKTYLDKLALLKVDISSLLELDDPILEAKFHPGNPAYKDDRYEYLKDNLDYYEKELKRNGVTRRLLHDEYCLSYTNGYGYTQFCFHLNQQIKARKPSMVLSHQAGAKLFIDFAGKKLSYIDKETGEVIQSPVFVACMPYSDYSFAMAVRSQCVEDFVHALTCALEHFGGVPQMLVPDNLKSAIIKASSYEPDINQILDDFANHYQTSVVPTRVAKPKDKALVENQVKLVYNRVFAHLRNEQFFDIQSLNKAISQRIKAHNQTRMQQKPYCREEKFLADEQQCLQALPDNAFEIKHYKEYKVAKNNHIYLAEDKHYYSVPYQWTGKQAKVVYTRTMIYIYAKGQQIAIHPRNHKPGCYSTVKEHLCSHHQHYLDRSPDYYINKAERLSIALHQLIQLLFKGGRPPEQNYRTCDGLLSLQRKTPSDVFEKACQHAIDCHCYSYRFVSNVIKNHQEADDSLQTQDQKQLPVHRNIRGKEYYTQTTINF